MPAASRRPLGLVSGLVLVLAACGAPPAMTGASEGTTAGSTTAATSDGGTTGDASTTVDSEGTTGETTSAETLPLPLPPLDAAPLTDSQTLRPAHPVEDVTASLDPREPAELDALLEMGFGDLEVGPGEPLVERTGDGSEPPTPGPNAALLTRFVHLADTQIVDDESPIRQAIFDNPGILAPVFRAQETYACQITNAAIRTINAIHAATPLDFVLLGGDNADNAQENELSWFLGILDGAAVVHCDSGDDDDPVAGPANDPKDPFAPVGLDVPWWWVTGNHDLLANGFRTAASQGAAAVGDSSVEGTRDWSQPGGPVITGPVVGDPRRAIVDNDRLLELVAASGDGHGIDDEVRGRGRADYTFDVDGTPLRVLVVDSAAPKGGPVGVIRGADVDAYIEPALVDAAADGKWVLVVSHHPAGDLGDGGGPGGEAIPDALTSAEWEALLGAHDHVVAHLVGHSHEHRARWVEPLGGHAYWEVTTAAIADFPHQMRLVEIADGDNGHLSLRLRAVDLALDGDALGAAGKARAVADHTSGWSMDGSGTTGDRNVVLWAPLP